MADACDVPDAEGTPVMVLIGHSGTGKSSLGNFVGGDTTEHPKFQVGEGGGSQTSATQSELVRWLGNGEHVVVVDTPGLSDSRNTSDGETDSAHISDMVDAIRQVDAKHAGVNTFVVVFNGQEPRFSDHIQRLLQ